MRSDRKEDDADERRPHMPVCTPSGHTPNTVSSRLSASHVKVARAKEIKAHFLQKQAAETKDKRALAEKRANGVIVSLGLVNADEGGDGK